MSSEKTLYEYEGKIYNSYQLSKLLKCSASTMTRWIDTMGFEDAIDFAKRKSIDPTITLHDIPLQPCGFCGIKTRTNFCSSPCRRKWYNQEFEKGTLDEKYITRRPCGCGCGREVAFVTQLKSTRFFNAECADMFIKQRTEEKLKIQNETKSKKIILADRFDRPKLCKTCAKYSKCADTMYKRDRGWPCELKDNWDDYTPESTDRPNTRLHAINTSDNYGGHHEY